MALAVRLSSVSLKNVGICLKRLPSTQPQVHQFHTLIRSSGTLVRSGFKVVTGRGHALNQGRRTFRQKRPEGSKRSLTPVEELAGPDPGIRQLVRPFGFMLLVSGGSYAGCSLWQYEKFRGRVKKKIEQYNDKFYGKAGEFRTHVNIMWNSFTASEKLMAGVIGINLAVFLLWRIAPANVMYKYFTSSPISGAPCLSMVLSTFSHFSFFHLAANMYVMWSFSSVAGNMFGKEQLLATYLTAGVVSSFTSYCYKVLKKRHNPSVGASGAIMALLGAVCIHHQDSRLSIAFVDQIFPHSFSATSAMKFIICMDFAGCVFGWRLFDHAGHLGGMLFGMWYATYGHKLIWGNREPFVRWWHELRGQSKK